MAKHAVDILLRGLRALASGQAAEGQTDQHLLERFVRQRDEAAAELGWTPGRLKGHLERGRERLRGRLIQRGLAPAAAGAVLLAETALAAPVPPLVAVATLRAAGGSPARRASKGCGTWQPRWGLGFGPVFRTWRPVSNLPSPSAPQPISGAAPLRKRRKITSAMKSYRA